MRVLGAIVFLDWISEARYCCHQLKLMYMIYFWSQYMYVAILHIVPMTLNHCSWIDWTVPALQLQNTKLPTEYFLPVQKRVLRVFCSMFLFCFVFSFPISSKKFVAKAQPCDHVCRSGSWGVEPDANPPFLSKRYKNKGGVLTLSTSLLKLRLHSDGGKGTNQTVSISFAFHFRFLFSFNKVCFF